MYQQCQMRAAEVIIMQLLKLNSISNTLRQCKNNRLVDHTHAVYLTLNSILVRNSTHKQVAHLDCTPD